MLIQNKKELQIPVQLSISKDQQELIQVHCPGMHPFPNVLAIVQYAHHYSRHTVL